MRTHGFSADPDDPDDPQKEADRQTASLAGVVVALVLVIIGLFLVHRLQVKASLEDCLMSGRQNCGSQISSVDAVWIVSARRQFVTERARPRFGYWTALASRAGASPVGQQKAATWTDPHWGHDGWRRAWEPRGEEQDRSRVLTL
jgi:hypothetical protein